MFKAHLFMYLAFILLMSNIISMLLDGSWVSAEDLNLMNWLTGYTSYEAAGAWAIPALGWGFLTEGLPRMIMWDFSFLRGALEIIRWIFMTLSVGVVGGLAIQFAPNIQNLFARR